MAALLAPTGLPASGQDTPAWMAARPGFGEHFGKKHQEEHILDHCINCINISSVLLIPFHSFPHFFICLHHCTIHLSRNVPDSCLPHLAPDLVAVVLVLLGPDVWGSSG